MFWISKKLLRALDKDHKEKEPFAEPSMIVVHESSFMRDARNERKIEKDGGNDNADDDISI